MAVNFSIKAVPDGLAERLRQRAERNHRSLQGELMAIIEAAVDGPAAVAAAAGRTPASLADRKGRPVVRKGMRRIEDIAAELHQRAEPQPGLPRSVDIVRQARDSR